MLSRDLVLRGLAHYWRTNIAVVLGVATAVAVLAGALLVGDSVRGSLRDLVMQHLGRADRAVVSTGFFREQLADDVATDPDFAMAFTGVCPLISTIGVVTDQSSGMRVSRVQVYGVDGRFWRFHGGTRVYGPDGRDALLNRALANDLGAAIGGSLVVRVERPSAIPIESLHGRKDDLGRSLRLNVREILDAAEMGDFSLQPAQGEVRAIFVPLVRLQQDLGVAHQVNVLLAAAKREDSASLEALVRRRFLLDDVGITVRSVGDVIAVEASAGLVDEPRAKAAEAAAKAMNVSARPVFTYLANTIKSGDRQVPYSLVTAMDLATVAPALRVNRDVPPIVINDWTARDLGVKVGDPLSLEYFVWEDPGRLVARSADFEIAAVVPIAGAAADRDLAPVYPGITEAKTLGDWDPPFPIDLRRIRRADEDYWNQYRTTPKAFIPLDVGRRLWQSRFGDRTSLRVSAPPSLTAGAARTQFVEKLRGAIDPLSMGLAVRSVRDEGLAASRGATDFGEYFTYFSFFLVVSALMLASLFFRLGVEQRGREVGLLRAVGYTTKNIRRLFSAEGAALAAIGGALGMAGAVGYGALMTLGLRTWWSGAVGTTAIRLHLSASSLATGAIGAWLASVVCIWWTLRGLARVSERALLAGSLASGPRTGGHYGRSLILASLFGGLGFALAIVSAAGRMNRTAGFFGAGSALLVAGLFAAAAAFCRAPRSSPRGWQPLWRVGLRNAGVRPGRSVLAIGVIASATFMVIAVDAFRRSGAADTGPHSGVGGYPLLVDLLVPLVNDPNERDGRDALGLAGADGVSVEPFRVLPGDDASCLNLYEPKRPRILGAGRRFIDAGRFAFQRSLAETDADRANPWRLLNRDFGADVVPVIADANSMTYVLHKNLGDNIVVAHGGGRPLRLRLVAALDDSIFQGELVMSEAVFTRLFPESEGYRFLLVEERGAAGPGGSGGSGGSGMNSDATRALAARIEEGAADLGADAVETTARLAEFHGVENTYLSTFQALGGLGLLVGTLGLAAVLLRNVLERRRELALLGAVGYRRRHIFTIILSENLLLLLCGLILGAFCAVVAIAPALMERGGRLPATASGGLLLVAVFLAGLLSSVVATRAALRTPLLAALRSE